MYSKQMAELLRTAEIRRPRKMKRPKNLETYGLAIEETFDVESSSLGIFPPNQSSIYGDPEARHGLVTLVI